MNVAWGHLGAFVGYHVRIGYPPHFHPGIRFIPHCCQKGQFFSGTNVSLPFTASIPRGHFKILVYTECLFFFWYLGSVTELVRLSYLQKPLLSFTPHFCSVSCLAPNIFFTLTSDFLLPPNPPPPPPWCFWASRAHPPAESILWQEGGGFGTPSLSRQC